MAERLILQAEQREPKEKQVGKLPAVLYGPKTENTPLFVNFNEFIKIWRQAGESTVIEIRNKNSVSTDKKPSFDGTPVLIYDIDLDPLTDRPRHVDFYAADMTKKTTATVSLAFEGEVPAVKTGGVLVKVIQEVEVESLPKDLPSEIKVDLSSLKSFEDKIIIADLAVPAGAEILANKEEVVALVEAPAEEAEEAVEAPKLEDIEVTKEKEKEEERREKKQGDEKNNQ